MKINALLVGFILVAVGAKAQSPTAKEVLEQSAVVLKSANLFQYVSEYRIKIFDSAMYLINNGKVVYAHYGHSAEKMNALEDAIIRVIEK